MSNSIRPPFPSAPSDPALRRLGIGQPGAQTRPIRAQLIVVVVLGLMLVAIPLYLWRRPSIASKMALDALDAGTAPSASSTAPMASTVLPSLPDAGALEPERVKLSPVKKVRCGASAKQANEQEGCDSLAYFEKALVEAVKASADCAPQSAKPGSINFVLQIDFARKNMSVFPGASGDWRGPRARRATKCVTNALPTPDWASIVHQHRYYAIAVMATFPGKGQ